MNKTHPSFPDEKENPLKFKAEAHFSDESENTSHKKKESPVKEKCLNNCPACKCRDNKAEE